MPRNPLEIVVPRLCPGRIAGRKFWRCHFTEASTIFGSTYFKERDEVTSDCDLSHVALVAKTGLVMVPTLALRTFCAYYFVETATPHSTVHRCTKTILKIVS